MNFPEGISRSSPPFAAAYSVVSRVPVRHDDSIETPLLLGYVSVEVAILRHVQAVGEVVGVHDRAYVSFLHRRFKRGQVDLTHGALVDDGIHVMPVVFLVVAHVVLDGRAHALALHAVRCRRLRYETTERDLLRSIQNSGRTWERDRY